MLRNPLATLLLTSLLAACAGSPDVAKREQGPAIVPAMTAIWPASNDTYRTTDGAIYLANLDGRIDALGSKHASDPAAGAALSLAGAHYHRFRIRGTLDDYDAAVALVAAERARADSVELRILSATLNNAMHRFIDAQADLARARELGARAEQLNALQRDLDLALGNYDALRQDYAQARTPTGAFHEQAFKAFLLNQQGDLAASSAAYALAQGLYQDVNPVPLAWLHVQQGIALLDRGRIAEAERFFRTASERLPGYALAEEHWAETLTLLGRHDEARRLYARVIEATGNPEYMAALSGLEADAGNAAAAQQWRERAVQAYQVWLQRHPLGYAEHAAEFHLEIGDHARARDLAMANAANRSDVESLVLLARIEQASGQPRSACETLQRANRTGLRTASLEAAHAQLACEA